MARLIRSGQFSPNALYVNKRIPFTGCAWHSRKWTWFILHINCKWNHFFWTIIHVQIWTYISCEGGKVDWYLRIYHLQSLDSEWFSSRKNNNNKVMYLTKIITIIFVWLFNKIDRHGRNSDDIPNHSSFWRVHACNYLGIKMICSVCPKHTVNKVLELMRPGHDLWYSHIML